MKYRCIVVDPPWPFRWSGGGWIRKNGRGERYVLAAKHRRLPYPVMQIADIEALPVSELAERDAHLYLWIPDRLLIEGVGARVLAAWGFKPGPLIVWEKTGFGLGTFPRPQHEVLITAKRGSLPYRVRDVGSVQRWRFSYENGARQHSRKPEGALDLIEQASPGPYLELFARRHRLGWDVHGFEVGSTLLAAAI